MFSSQLYCSSYKIYQCFFLFAYMYIRKDIMLFISVRISNGPGLELNIVQICIQRFTRRKNQPGHWIQLPYPNQRKTTPVYREFHRHTFNPLSFCTCTHCYSGLRRPSCVFHRLSSSISFLKLLSEPLIFAVSNQLLIVVLFLDDKTVDIISKSYLPILNTLADNMNMQK